MPNTYKPVSEWAKAKYGSDNVELDLGAAEEGDHLDGGHLELVPRKYKVLSDNFSAAGQGEEFEGAYRVDIEAALLGVHIERVEPAKKTAKKTSAKKSDDD